MLTLFSLPQLVPMTQDDHFKAGHLAEVFRSKIAKSQATGKDGVRINRFHDIVEVESQLIERKISNKSYRFTRFKERLILRGYDRNPRQISIPTVRDRLTLRTICQVLHTYIPATRGAAPHTLVKQVVEAVRAGDDAHKSFVRLDVRDFFPSISHSILRRELTHFKSSKLVIDLCMNAIRTSSGSGEAINERGIPQGLSISNALSAVFMLRFDNRRKKEFENYFRYVDDILLIVNTASADDALKRVGRTLSSRGLIVHKKGVAGKTEISPVSDGIDFLGYRIGVDKVSIRSSSYKKMFKNLLKVITDFRYRQDVDRLTFRLNLKITGCVVDNKRRGWMMFFSFTEDLSQLAFLDTFVKKHLIRVGFPQSELAKINKFVKSHHEIKFNMDQTAYIPNFDNFDNAKRAAAISALTKYTFEEVMAWDALRIDEEFSRLISREVHDLEQDIGNIS